VIEFKRFDLLCCVMFRAFQRLRKSKTVVLLTNRLGLVRQKGEAVCFCFSTRRNGSRARYERYPYGYRKYMCRYKKKRIVTGSAPPTLRIQSTRRLFQMGLHGEQQVGSPKATSAVSIERSHILLGADFCWQIGRFTVSSPTPLLGGGGLLLVCVGVWVRAAHCCI
jgi:hypothetical protein